MKLIAIKTKSGTFITKNVDNKSYNSYSFGNDIFFDGKIAENTFHDDWYRVENVPKLIQKNVKQPNINHTYILRDYGMVSDKIPKTLLKSDVEYYDEDGDSCWKDAFAHLRSLYELVYDTQPNKLEDVEFEIVKILEFDGIEVSNGFSYPVQNSQYVSDGFGEITQKSVENQMLDKIVFPSILLSSRPCTLTSQQSYKIIRKHIQDNIDPRYSHITSDHDFCFTVKKKIPLSEKESFMSDENFFKRTKKVKMVKRFVNDREITAFEMTYSPYNYSGYTPIKPFIGKNHKDLKKNIETFLKNLVVEINEPLVDCPKCKGMGVILDKS